MKFKDILHRLKEEKKNIAQYLRNDNNFRFEVANLITEARIHAGLTQEELSNLINTKQPSIARWEAAASLPSLRSLKKIADAIGTYLVPPKFGFMEGIKINEKGPSTEIQFMLTNWFNSEQSHYSPETNAATQRLPASYVHIN